MLAFKIIFEVLPADLLPIPLICDNSVTTQNLCKFYLHQRVHLFLSYTKIT